MPSTVESNIRLTEQISTIVCVAALFASAQLSVRKWQSPIVLLLLALLLFHLPIALFRVVNLPFATLRQVQITTWLEGASYQRALELLVIVCLAYVAGAALLLTIRGRRSIKVKRVRCAEYDAHVIGAAGGLMLLAGVGLWATFIVLSLGFGGFFSSYDQYVEFTSHLPIGWANVLIGFGLAIAAAGRASPLQRAGLLAFSIFAVLALKLGLRGEVLFPALAAVAVHARVASRPAFRRWLILALLLLPVLTLVSQTRGEGRRAPLSAWDMFNPTDVLIETGSTVRLPLEAIQFQWSGGEVGALQVLSDSVRFMASNLVPLPNADDPPERIGLKLNARSGGPSGIGSSPVAEFYLSGGAWLLLLYGLTVGICVAVLDGLDTSPWENALVGVVLFPLLVSVRNEFVFVPYHVLAGGTLLWLLYVGRRTLRKLLLPS